MKPKIQDGNFCQVTKQAMAEGRYDDYMKEVLKDYEAYKNEFDDNFTEANPPGAVYRFKVEYLLKKPVWREIEILGRQTFARLSNTIIDSMGWNNDHMHGFSFPDPKDKSMLRPSPYTFFADGWEDDPHPTFKSTEIRICDIDYKKQPRLGFLFDFGDGHMFNIEFKGFQTNEKKAKAGDYPRVVDQRGIAPEQYPALEE